MKTLLTLAFAVLAFLPQSFAMDHGNHAHDKMKTETHKAKAVVFYADNCGACKILDPKMKEAMKAINMDMIDVIKFDFSNSEAIEATKALAKEKSVDNVLQSYGAKTGFVVLLDASGVEVGTLKVDHSISEIAGKLASTIIGNS